MQSDAEAIQAVLASRREAFGDLVRRYESTVHAVAMGVLRDHHAAQDVCQETFVAAYRNLARLRDSASLGSWLVRIARNHALTLARRRRIVQPLADPGEF
jgi:RNA polymerase sigma-70 factor (ECF subfamily)